MIWKITIAITIAIILTLLLFKGEVRYEPTSPQVNTEVPEKPEALKKATSTPNVPGKFGLTIIPEAVRQGEPVVITVNGATSTSAVRSLTLSGQPFILFVHEGKVMAIKGIDLNAPTGTFPIVLTLTDGRQFQKNLTILKRELVVRPFDIPEKLGGNTPQSERELFRTLAEETRIVNAILTSREKFWTEEFQSPLREPLVVNDPFGYTRTLVNSTMPHKGVDLYAPMNTPIYAMNRGVVRFVGKNLRNYGNTIVIDHGAGVQTIYMHLSGTKVAEGQMVERGELIGTSGDTGYVLDPHLHLTVRIWEVSVDPLKFLEIL